MLLYNLCFNWLAFYKSSLYFLLPEINNKIIIELGFCVVSRIIKASASVI